MRIELKAEGVSFVSTPPVPGKSDRTAGQKTSSFLKTQRCQVAINGSAFSPVVNEEGKEQTVVGLHVSKGAVVSNGNGKYDALLFSKANRAWVSSPPFELKDVETAVGGFQIVLKGGEVPKDLPNYNSGPIHPRTAAGVSADGRHFYLLAIDGRQPAWSEGATIPEVGQWLKCLGAAEGINLDGGGTTTLVVEGTDGRPNVLNKPIHGNVPGRERVAGSHLGVYAKPLKPKE